MTDSKKVVVFIDGSNFYYSLQKSFSTSKIDFEKLNKKVFYVGFPKTKSYHLNTVCDYTIK